MLREITILEAVHLGKFPTQCRGLQPQQRDQRARCPSECGEQLVEALGVAVRDEHCDRWIGRRGRTQRARGRGGNEVSTVAAVTSRAGRTGARARSPRSRRSRAFREVSHVGLFDPARGSPLSRTRPRGPSRRNAQRSARRRPSVGLGSKARPRPAKVAARTVRLGITPEPRSQSRR